MAPRKQYTITADELRNMHYKQLMTPQEIADSFGCHRSLIDYYFQRFGMTKRPKNQNLLGKRFGRLTVIQFLGIQKRQARWLCQCDCGSTTTASTAMLNLKLQSCGCLTLEKTTTHHMSRTRPYRIWMGMRSRCDNSSQPVYKYYGARGVHYCPEWSTFEGFWKDMQPGYVPDKTLDRVDNDGNYCPENCVWATNKEQSQHKTNNALLTYNGQTMNITQWSLKLGLPRSMLYGRKALGWSDQETIETPRLR